MAVGVEGDAGEAEIHPRRRLRDARAERLPARDRHRDVRFAFGRDGDLAAPWRAGGRGDAVAPSFSTGIKSFQSAPRTFMRGDPVGTFPM